VRGRTFSGDAGAGERCRAFDGICDVGLVVGAVEIDTVPAAVCESVIAKEASGDHLRWVQDVRANTAWAWVLGEAFSI
jgi:hypothetical protein